MADKSSPKAAPKPKDAKSLTIREAYDLHKVIGEKEKYLAFISGYARGYHDKSVGNEMRWGDEDVLATTAGTDLLKPSPDTNKRKAKAS